MRQPEMPEISDEINLNHGEVDFFSEYDQGFLQQKLSEVGDLIDSHRQTDEFFLLNNAPLPFAIPLRGKGVSRENLLAMIHQGIQWVIAHQPESDEDTLCSFLNRWIAQTDINLSENRIEEIFRFWRQKLNSYTPYDLADRYIRGGPLFLDASSSLAEYLDALDPIIAIGNIGAIKNNVTRAASQVTRIDKEEKDKDFKEKFSIEGYRKWLLKRYVDVQNLRSPRGLGEDAIKEFWKEAIQVHPYFSYYKILGMMVGQGEKVGEILDDNFNDNNEIARNITRILRLSNTPVPDRFPQDIPDGFEDSFGLGISFYQSMASQFSESLVYFRNLRRRYVIGEVENEDISSDIKEKAPPLMRIYRYLSTTDQYLDLATTCPSGKKGVKTWNFHDEKNVDIPSFFKTPVFFILYDKLGASGSAQLKKILHAFIDKDNTGYSLSSFCYLSLHHETVRRDFKKLLETDEALFGALIDCVKRTNIEPITVASCLKILAEYCGNDEKRLKNVVRRLFATKEDFDNPQRSIQLFVFLANFEDTQKALENIPVLLLQTRILGDTEGFTRDSIAWFREFERFHVIQRLDPAIKRRAIESVMGAAHPTRKFYAMLREKQLPPGFDVENARQDILERTSIPLLEEHQTDLSHNDEDSINLLRGSIHLSLTPSDGEHLPPFSWRAVLTVRKIDDDGYFCERFSADFQRAALAANNIQRQRRDPIERVVLYAAQQYFVRTQPQSQEEEILIRNDDPNEDGPGPDSAPSNGEVKIVNEREAAPLTVDVSDSQMEQDHPHIARLFRTMEENKQRVAQLLQGRSGGINLDDVIVHQRFRGLENGQQLYQRVETDELQLYIDENQLATDDLFILNSLPFMGALGYRPLRRRVNGGLSPVWEVIQRRRSDNARLAYGSYLESNFPPLSDFTEYNAMMGILTDAHYSEDGITQISEILPDGTTNTIAMLQTIERDMHSRLVQTVRNTSWQEEWIQTQRRICEDEISDIEHSSLPQTERETLIRERREFIAQLPAQMRQTAGNTHILLERSRNETRVKARLALGWLPTETSFNQGQYISLREFAGFAERYLEAS